MRQDYESGIAEGPGVGDNLAHSNKVAPPWHTLVLVCTNCRGARKGPDASEIRKRLKRELGKAKSLRVVEVDCLKDCPDHAIATCIAHTTAPLELHRIASHAELDALAAELGRAT